MIKSKITVSALVDKTTSKLESIISEYRKKIEKLEDFLLISNDYSISLSKVQIDIVNDKIIEYGYSISRINKFIEWKKTDFKNVPPYWFTDEEVKQVLLNNNRRKKLERL